MSEILVKNSYGLLATRWIHKMIGYTKYWSTFRAHGKWAHIGHNLNHFVVTDVMGTLFGAHRWAHRWAHRTT